MYNRPLFFKTGELNYHFFKTNTLNCEKKTEIKYSNSIVSVLTIVTLWHIGIMLSICFKIICIIILQALAYTPNSM